MNLYYSLFLVFMTQGILVQTLYLKTVEDVSTIELDTAEIKSNWEPEDATMEPATTTTVKITTMKPAITKTEKTTTVKVETTTTARSTSSVTTTKGLLSIGGGVTRPSTTIMKSEATTMEPKTSTIEPKTTTVESKTTTMEPKTTTFIPKTTTMKPSTSTMKSSTTVEPKTSTIKPNTITLEPEATTMMLESTTMEPNTMTMKPESSTTDDPNTITLGPEATSMMLEDTTMVSTTTTAKTTTMPPLPTMPCPYSYTGSQCNFQTFWCPNQLCIGDQEGNANCFDYTSYQCNCKNNESCVIEKAEPSFLNGLNCFDINTASKQHGVYYNFYSEMLNYHAEPIVSYTCGCRGDFGTKGKKECSLRTCAQNTTNPCSTEEACLDFEPISNAFNNVLFCSCEPGIECFKEHQADLCYQNPCAENAICLVPYTNSYFTESFSSVDLKASFTCKCSDSFDNAKSCFKPIDPCSKEENFCQNGGTCLSYFEANLSKSMCLCTEGTTGKTCDQFVKCLEPLKSGREPCLFGGECTSSLVDYFSGVDYKCKCQPGFAGAYCNECASNPCENGGSCMMNADATVQCMCLYGYKGDRCQIRYDYCEYNDNFMCDETSGECSTYKDFYCNCSAETATCRMQLCDFRNDKGNCVDVADNRTCIAPPDYHSYGCNCYMFSRTLYEKNSVNGRCNLGNMDSCHEQIYSVDQAMSWYYEVQAMTNICQRDESCAFGFESYLSYFSYFCGCEPGKDCFNQGLLDPCKEHNMCGDKATCLAYSQINQYFCKCDANATASECYKETNPCSSNPCQNGGTCLGKVDPLTRYRNDGGQVITATPAPQTATCICPKGAYGPNCESLKDYCSIPFCGAHGKCLNTQVGKFKCECDDGYTGKFCDIPALE